MTPRIGLISWETTPPQYIPVADRTGNIRIEHPKLCKSTIKKTRKQTQKIKKKKIKGQVKRLDEEKLSFSIAILMSQLSPLSNLKSAICLKRLNWNSWFGLWKMKHAVVFYAYLIAPILHYRETYMKFVH